MTESSRRIPWKRILVEGATIVVSILLAFAIDAAWNERDERQQEEVLLRGLLSDFRATRPDLQLRGESAGRMVANTRRLRDLLDAQPGAGPVEVPDSLIVASIGAPTYQPATNTLEAALASGDLGLIRHSEIKELLARWRLTLLDTFESEQEVRRIGIDRVEPLLARNLALGPFFDAVMAWDREGVAVSGHTRLTPSSELSSALASRIFYQQFAEQGLAELLVTLDELSTLIRAELGSQGPGISRR